MSEVTQEQVVTYIKNMSLMDAANLVKKLEDELGVTAAAPIAMVAGAAPAAGAAAVKKTTEFTIVLEDPGPERVKAIKVVRELTGLGLKASGKSLVAAIRGSERSYLSVLAVSIQPWLHFQ